MSLLGTTKYETGFHKVKLGVLKGQEKNLGWEDGISPYELEWERLNKS